MSGPITDIPIWLGDALGITAENAGILLSVGILTSLSLVLAMLGRKNLNMLTVAVPLMATMCFLVAVAWLPYWPLLVIGILTGVEFARQIRGMAK